MGCCPSRTSSSESVPTVNLNQNRTKRAQNWKATGQIILRDGNLKELPEGIADVGPAAKLLDAQNNCITELPPSLAALPNVHRLVLAKNLLENLHNVTSLTNLKALIVDHNQLGHLPEQIGSLSKLETLSCSHNLLLSLPASTGKLGNLKFLNCSSNKIIRLPNELGEATALEELNASDNYLQELPASVGHLTKLKSINLDKNQLRQIPAQVLQGCTLLQALSLHSNPITPRVHTSLIYKHLHRLLWLVLEETPGFQDFEQRRQRKVTKQMAGGAIQNLDEGIDRNLADKAV